MNDIDKIGKAQAAIDLKVPRSGIPELDAMIRESRRLDMATAAMQGIIADPNVDGSNHGTYSEFMESLANDSFDIADALLAASEKEKQEPWPFSADRVTYHKAAPVVPPDMVMVPREATEAMLDAAMNRYKHVSPEARLRFFQMHRENFRCDYKAMIAAAEGNESK